MIAHAHCVHSMEGRTRLRVPSRSRDKAYFGRVKERLEACEGVERVTVNPLTASVVVQFRPGASSYGDFAEKEGLFVLKATGTLPAIPPGRRLWDSLARLNHRLVRFSHGEEDLSSLAFLVLVGLGIYQVTKGKTLPAATALFAQALSIAAREQALPVEVELETEFAVA